MGRRERWAWGGLLVFALLLRLWALGDRPPHHDEAVHAHFAHELLHQGTYRYDPTYHGPLLFYVMAPLFAVFGESDATSRLYPALAGVALVALPLALRRRVGARTAWFAGLICAISPTFLYYSRFARNELPVALFTAAAGVLFLRVRRDGWKPLPWIGVAAALHAISKETFYVTLPLVTAAALAVAFHRGFWDSVERGVHWLRLHSRPVATGVLWFFVITMTAYTFVFIHPEDFFFPGKAIMYWYGQHKVERVGGPWFYHLPRLALYEFLPIVAALAWGARRWRRLRPVEVFCLAWGIASVAMYCYLGEKVPWLAVHQVLPFILLGAMQLSRAFGPQGRWWSRSLAALGLAGTMWSAVALSFVYPTVTTSDPHAELMVFVQTTPEAGELARHGIELARQTDDDPIAAVDGEGAWPLSWSWRNLKVFWSVPGEGMRPPLVVCDAANEEKVSAALGEGYTMRHVPLRAWWVETYDMTPWELVRWFVTRRAWSPIGATEVTVFERPLEPREPERPREGP
jgi:uncharacterized protein (TIGR03663 family)